MEDISKKYDNGEITVLWQPHLCIHSANCARGLPGVFNPRVKPWVNIHAAETERIVKQVANYPSGALSILKKEEQ